MISLTLLIILTYLEFERNSQTPVYCFWYSYDFSVNYCNISSLVFIRSLFYTILDQPDLLRVSILVHNCSKFVTYQSVNVYLLFIEHWYSDASIFFANNNESVLISFVIIVSRNAYCRIVHKFLNFRLLSIHVLSPYISCILQETSLTISRYMLNN